MTDCCNATRSTNTPPRKFPCPANHKEYSGVSATTILHHIKRPWDWDNKSQSYYFCDDPDCDVVYFGQDNSVITRQALRTPVGKKEQADTSLICYCFGINLRDAKTNRTLKEFVIHQTANHACACTVRNPSGRCCLKDFPALQPGCDH